jgi:hypothetical protein
MKKPGGVKSLCQKPFRYLADALMREIPVLLAIKFPSVSGREWGI